MYQVREEAAHVIRGLSGFPPDDNIILDLLIDSNSLKISRNVSIKNTPPGSFQLSAHQAPDDHWYCCRTWI